MKKFLKPLIIATSVACVAGIGAVSYAAWEGTKKQNADGGQTATITTLAGLSTVTAPTDKLLPYDQPGTPAAGNTEMWTLAVATEGDASAYDLWCKATITPATGKNFKGKLYYQVADTAPTAPADVTTDSNWAELTAGTEVKVVDTIEATAKTYNVYVILASTDSSNDMGATIDFKFELNTTTPTAA